MVHTHWPVTLCYLHSAKHCLTYALPTLKETKAARDKGTRAESLSPLSVGLATKLEMNPHEKDSMLCLVALSDQQIDAGSQDHCSSPNFLLWERYHFSLIPLGSMEEISFSCFFSPRLFNSDRTYIHRTNRFLAELYLSSKCKHATFPREKPLNNRTSTWCILSLTRGCMVNLKNIACVPGTIT